MKLTTERHLGQRLKISGAIPLLPLYAYMESTGKTVPFDFGSLNMSVQTDNTEYSQGSFACLYTHNYLSLHNVNKCGNQ